MRNYKVTNRGESLFWNNLTHEEWSALRDNLWKEFKAGRHKVQIPEGILRIEAEWGDFVEVIPSCSLDDEPHIAFYERHYGPALKVMIPKKAKAGDWIHIVRESQSGKSLIAEVCEP